MDNNSSQQLRSEAKYDRDAWMVTYGSLLTGVLAFFLLLVGRTTSEAESLFRFTDNLTQRIGQQLSSLKNEAGYPWLYIEDTGNKGIKLLIPASIDDKSSFETGKAELTEDFQPFIEGIAGLLLQTDLSQINRLYQDQIDLLHSAGKDIDISIKVEGHTDIRAIKTANFRDNWELSTARAYTVMQLIQQITELPENYFSLGGYAYFHPLKSLENYDENRRVELYIKVNMVDKRQ
jgi:chemotaxis protein MotB